MSIANSPSRPPEAFQVHRQLKGPKESHKDVPSREISPNEKYMKAPSVPVPSANTGKSSKFTSKSPLVSTMNSAIK